MKKVLWLIFAIMLFAACDKGGDSTITSYDHTQLDQTLYADQTEGDFTFTAAESWTTQIADSTPAGRAASDMWITLDPSHGDAGTVNMKITLSPNLTGKDRTATIRIVCGDTTITITVEQKATTESGGEPEIPATPKAISRINSFTDGAADGHVTFEYDAQGRTKQFCIYAKNGTLEYKAVMTYTDRKIKIESYSKDGDIPDTDISELTLDANGRVISFEETIDGENIKVDYTYDTAGYLIDYYAGSWYEPSSEAPLAATHKSRANAIRPQINHAVWENGNLKTLYEDWQNGVYGDKTEYEYTNHRNGFATIDLMMGAMSSELLILKVGTYGKIRKNLIAKETVTSKYPYIAGVYNWSYKFDNTGFYVTEFTRAFTAADPKANYTETYKIIYQ